MNLFNKTFTPIYFILLLGVVLAIFLIVDNPLSPYFETTSTIVTSHISNLASSISNRHNNIKLSIPSEYNVCISASGKRDFQYLYLTISSLFQCQPYPSIIYIVYDTLPSSATIELLNIWKSNGILLPNSSIPYPTKVYWTVQTTKANMGIYSQSTEKIIYCLETLASNPAPLIVAEDDVVFVRQIGKFVTNIGEAAKYVHNAPSAGVFISLYEADWQGNYRYTNDISKYYFDYLKSYSETKVELDYLPGSANYCVLHRYVRLGWIGYGTQAHLYIGNELKQRMASCLKIECYENKVCFDLGVNSCLHKELKASLSDSSQRIDAYTNLLDNLPTSSVGVYTTKHSIVQHTGLVSTLWKKEIGEDKGTGSSTDEKVFSTRWHIGAHYLDFNSKDMPVKDWCYGYVKFSKCETIILP